MPSSGLSFPCHGNTPFLRSIEGLPSFKFTYCCRIRHYQDLPSGYATLMQWQACVEGILSKKVIST
jgi:hypothetical protein